MLQVLTVLDRLQHEIVRLVARPDAIVPPVDVKALRDAIKAARAD